MLEQQQALPATEPEEDASPKRPASRGRLASEDLRPQDLDARSEARQLDQYDASVLSARNKARNMGYGLQVLVGAVPEEPAVPAGPGPIDDAASVAQRAKQRNSGTTDLLGQRV